MRELRIGAAPIVGEDDHIRGSSTAPVTVLVYGDYECPHTWALEMSVARRRRVDRESFRYVFRYFPLRDIHPHAQMAAEAAEAVYALAGPNAFWIMHDALFANQSDLGWGTLERLASAAGVDASVFRAAVESRRFAERVELDIQSGRANGVDRTPSVFINGERYLGARDTAALRKAFALASAR